MRARLALAAALVSASAGAAELARFVAMSNAQQVVWITVAAPTNGTAWRLEVADLIPDGWTTAGYADAGKCCNFFRLVQERPFDADWKARYWALRNAVDRLDPVFRNWEVLEGRETSAAYDPIRCLRNFRDTYRKLRSSWEVAE